VKDVDCETAIQTMGWAELRDMWDKIQTGSATGWDSGKAFEYLVPRAFQLDGARIRWPYRISLHEEIVEQIDGVVEAAGLHCLLESKDWSKPISIDPIAILRNQLLRRPASTIGMVFSRSGYAEAALLLAGYLGGQTILLWHPGEISLALTKERIVPLLAAKYRACVESGIHDANTEYMGVL
jgi:hypothetical protein